ncbi:MAG: hypothetical protein A2481_01005 [Candidatus Yonathbacteria bacterium RIFOXYC2_FULL_47_9]|nr:MAG: hypothetical protein A2481_01005 [Candidatus Yonathbacteria bacterium RIFOXYC2_FULL_47_9]HAT68756.1 hypothetical protein [Candidatus Yonathbacteria bacterium]
MGKSVVLKIFMSAVLLFVVVAVVLFVLGQSDKKSDTIGETTPISSPAESVSVYTEEEKINILQSLSEAAPASTTKKESVTPKVTNSTISADEAQKRIQILKQIPVPVDTTSPSDEEKLRILNALSGVAQ